MVEAEKTNHKKCEFYNLGKCSVQDFKEPEDAICIEEGGERCILLKGECKIMVRVTATEARKLHNQGTTIYLEGKFALNNFIVFDCAVSEVKYREDLKKVTYYIKKGATNETTKEI